MQKAKDKIKQSWEENPLMTVGVAIAAVSAAVEVTKAITNLANSRTWRKEVNRRAAKKAAS